MQYLTREAWIQLLMEELRSLFATRGVCVPTNLTLTWRWPTRRRRCNTGRHVLGECWQTANGHYVIGICVCLDDPVVIAATLVHEAIHTVVGLEDSHGTALRRIARAMGLEGNMDSTRAGLALRSELSEIIQQLGPLWWVPRRYMI